MPSAKGSICVKLPIGWWIKGSGYSPTRAVRDHALQKIAARGAEAASVLAESNPTGEFPHLRYADLPDEAVKVSLGMVRGILCNASDVRRAEETTAKNAAMFVLRTVGWEPRP